METKHLGAANVRQFPTETDQEIMCEHKLRAAETRLRRRLMIKQKLMGFAMLIITVMIFVMAAHGDPSNPLETDVTAAFLTGPLALYLLFSRRINIYATDRDCCELNMD